MLMLWRPALFFITIVVVTPSGRAAVDEYGSQVIALLDAQAPYSYVTLIFIAATALACLLMMLEWRRQKPVIYHVCREIRYGIGHAAAESQPLRPRVAGPDRSRRMKLRHIQQLTWRRICCNFSNAR